MGARMGASMMFTGAASAVPSTVSSGRGCSSDAGTASSDAGAASSDTGAAASSDKGAAASSTCSMTFRLVLPSGSDRDSLACWRTPRPRT